MLDPKDEGTMIFQNTGYHSSNDTEWHPKRWYLQKGQLHLFTCSYICTCSTSWMTWWELGTLCTDITTRNITMSSHNKFSSISSSVKMSGCLLYLKWGGYFIHSIGICRMQWFLAVLRSFFHSSLLCTIILHSFHWHVQNATIPCRSQELLPFLSVTYS